MAELADAQDLKSCVPLRDVRVRAPLRLLEKRSKLLKSWSLWRFLCAHGSKHMFERLAWICDIARFLIVTPDLDWTAIVEHSRRTRTLRQLLLSMRLSADLLHVQPPVDLPKDPVVEPLVRDVRDRLLAGATPPATRSESARFCLRLLEPPSHKVRFLYRQYVTPSEAEYRVLQLPPPLYFLYYPFRPMRLLWRHAIRRS